MRRPAELTLTLCLWAALAGGCGARGGETMRVGAKGFAEQAILSQAVVQLLRQGGHTRAVVEPCGDTYTCMRSLQSGKLDLMVEYSGTGVTFMGGQFTPGKSALPEARRLYADLGLSWLGSLGFDNGYRLLVTAELGSALDLRSIGHLARVGRRVRVALPREYLRRPRDGLASLSRRYGLRFAGEPLVIEDPGERYRALFQGRADVAVGYATDGVIGRLGLRVLQDPLSFFPPYEAALLVRKELLKRHPRLAGLLGKLEGRLDTAAMQRLNYQVQVQRRAPTRVAAGFLHRAGLLTSRPQSHPSRELVLAVHRADRVALQALLVRGLQAAHAAYPERPAAVREVADPAARVQAAGANLAILGAERFFSRDGPGAPVRDTRVEAVAVLGTRVLHLVRRSAGARPLAGRFGVPPSGSGGARVAQALLALAGNSPAMHGTQDTLLQALVQGRLEAILLLAVAGDAQLVERLRRHQLRVSSLTWQGVVSGRGAGERPRQAVQLPYLRPARIPAGTYPGQVSAVDTLGAQVLLAGPARGPAASAGGGPAAALPVRSAPLEQRQVQALAKATGVAEAPDPVLPSAWSVRSTDQGHGAPTTSRRTLDTVLNLVAVSFIAWLFVLMRRKRA